MDIDSRGTRLALMLGLVLAMVVAGAAVAVLNWPRVDAGFDADHHRPSPSASLDQTGSASLGPAPQVPGNGTGEPAQSSTPPIPEPTVSAQPSGPSVPDPAVPSAAMASLAQQAQQKADASASAVFRVATFNVLGASHTRPKGGSRIKRPYSTRMNYAIQTLAAHKADVVSFQEFESVQAKLFDKLVGTVWGLWPAAGGRGADGRNSIGYHRATWDLVQGSSLTVPYFNGHAFHTPVALLRHKASGRMVWFISVHNAADTRKYRNQGRWRAEAVAAELAAVRRLGSDGTPVILLGDMNSRDLFYCTAVNSGLGLTFPNPGSGSGASCVGPKPSTIDWIVGTSGVGWTGYVKDRSELTKLATDHPVYSATAMLR